MADEDREPTREDLLLSMDGADRMRCLAKDTPADLREGLLDFYRRQWKERNAAARQGEGKAEPPAPSPEPEPQTGPDVESKSVIQALRDEIDRAGKVMGEATELLRRRTTGDRIPVNRPDFGKPMSRQTLRALELRRALEEEYGDNPDKAALLPPPNASVQELHKWYERMSQPVYEPLTPLDAKRAREAKAKAGKEVQQPPPVLGSQRDPFAPTDRGKIIGGIIIAFVALIFCFAAAYQNAGVVNVFVAHILIGLGWVGFMASIGFADYYMPLSRPQKIKLLLVVGVVSLVIASGADILMVYLKAQQQAGALPVSSPEPSPIFTPSPKAPSTPISPVSRLTPAYFNGEVSFTGGSPHRLDNVLRAAGYKGPMTLETLEFYNPSDVSVCWRVGGAGAMFHPRRRVQFSGWRGCDSGLCFRESGREA